jgi:hypothetical protein
MTADVSLSLNMTYCCPLSFWGAAEHRADYDRMETPLRAWNMIVLEK